MNPTRVLIALFCLGLILLGLSRLLVFRTPDRPMGTVEDIQSIRDRDDLNLVVVVIDTLRADRMSSYGYERETSPIMDAIAQSGIRFHNTLAQSTWTKTSMASMLTATYPAKNRITRFDHALPDDVLLPSEILQRAGYRTVGIWRNGWVSGKFGFDQGYDFYVKPTPNPTQNPAANPSASKLAGSDQDVIGAATQFIRSSGDEPFYLYLHLMDVHQYVYDGSVEFGTNYSDIYDQSIHFVDANVGTLFAVLQQEGLMKNTVLAIVSDHGEAFQEHGSEGHAQNLYTETINVPFIVALPFRLEEPLVVKTPVQNVDIFPTLFDLMGLPPLKEADGVSMLPQILAAGRGEETISDDGMRYAQLDTAWGRGDEPKNLVMVESGDYRLHLWSNKNPEIYDVANDPGEQRNLLPGQPELAGPLKKAVVNYSRVPEPSWGSPDSVELSDMEAANLVALGYFIDPHAPPDQRAKDPHDNRAPRDEPEAQDAP